MSVAKRVRIHSIETLSDNWYILRKATFDFLRSDGTWQRQSREAYDRGNGAAVLLFNREQRTVILTEQFRYPAFANGHDDLMIEAPAGLLDKSSPEESIRKETMEETGFVIHDVTKIFEAFMSPGSVTEKLHFFIAEYDPKAKRTGRWRARSRRRGHCYTRTEPRRRSTNDLSMARSKTQKQSCCCNTPSSICFQRQLGGPEVPR